MLDVDVIGIRLAGDQLNERDVRQLCELAASSGGIEEGHVAVELVEPDRIAALNRDHRGRDGPTDVLSFPIDDDGQPPVGPRELGDVIICPAHTEDLREAVIHGVLHLTGMDHERDDGEMLILQAELLRWLSD